MTQPQATIGIAMPQTTVALLGLALISFMAFLELQCLLLGLPRAILVAQSLILQIIQLPILIKTFCRTLSWTIHRRIALSYSVRTHGQIQMRLQISK
jgi:hypothetical protein